jgi:hypothetical protein
MSRTPGRWAGWKNVQEALALTPSSGSSRQLLPGHHFHHKHLTQLEEVTATLAWGKNEAQTHSCSLPSSQKTTTKENEVVKEEEDKDDDGDDRFPHVLERVVADWRAWRDEDSHLQQPLTPSKAEEQTKTEEEERRDQRVEGRRDEDQRGG